MNPFDETEKDHLYNIATGKAASTETEDLLLNIQEKGEKAQKKFIGDCIENPKRFEDRICRQKLPTFATEAGKRSEIKWKRNCSMLYERPIWKSSSDIIGEES